MRYLFTLPKMAEKKKKVTRIGEDVEKLEFSYTAGGNVEWYGYFGKHSGCSSEC